jgi:hypothetical protein
MSGRAKWQAFRQREPEVFRRYQMPLPGWRKRSSSAAAAMRRRRDSAALGLAEVWRTVVLAYRLPSSARRVCRQFVEYYSAGASAATRSPATGACGSVPEPSGAPVRASASRKTAVCVLFP